METINDSAESLRAEPFAEIATATQPKHRTKARTIAFLAGALVTPIAVGAGIAALTRSRRAGILAGGITAVAAAALRWQLQRWWTEEPAYAIEGRAGELEIRRYAARVEARTRLSVPDFETAVDEGFRRLASYIFGDNSAAKQIAMTTPVLTTPRASTHTVAFVMPPERTLADLPKPTDERIQLVAVPERRVAVLCFRGRYTDKVMLEQTRRLHELVAAHELETTGQPTFAGFDPPTTLPWLRRTEMWIELA